MPTLERGGGAAEDDGGFFPTGAQDGHVSGIVAGGLVLLVGRLVLFIDDDHAGIFHWRENRTSRADHDSGMAGVDFVPLVMALPLGKVAVQNRDSVLDVGKAGFEAFHGLRSQGDFRNENQGGFACIE